MPVYEYRCGGGHHYERTEGFNAPREHECSACGATAKRQISLPAVIFKGSGFYSTDNRKSGGANGRSGEPEPVSTSSDGHGHSHDGESHSHGSDSGSKVEAAASE